MPTYIMLSTLTPEGVQTVKNNPSRIREVNQEVEQLGATVKAQWATLGHFDFVNIVEAPDEKTMGACRSSSAPAGPLTTSRWQRSRSTTSSPRRRGQVFVVGGGGREHAIVRALLRSPQRPQVFAAPGNAGIARDATIVPDGEVAGMDLVVVGPEALLVAGLADDCAAAGVACFGPTAAAARLEGLKAFAKEVMAVAGVPTGGYAVVESVDEGSAADRRLSRRDQGRRPGGRQGVVIAPDERAARDALRMMLVEPLRRGPRSSSRSSSTGRSCPCSRSATARPRSAGPGATTSASATATPA